MMIQPGTSVQMQIGQQSSSQITSNIAIPQQPQQQQQRPTMMSPPISMENPMIMMKPNTSPSSSVSPQKPIPATASSLTSNPIPSPTSSGSHVSLTNSLPTNMPTSKPVQTNSITPTGSIGAMSAKENIIPPIPQHHKSTPALSSILPSTMNNNSLINQPQSNPQQQQQQQQQPFYSMVQNTTITQSSSVQATSPNPMFAFDQLTINPSPFELQQQQQQQQQQQPKPVFSNQDEVKKNMDKYHPIETLSPKSEVLSEEKIRKEVEEKIRKEVEERVRREYEEKMSNDKKSTPFSVPPAQTTTTSSHSSTSSSTTTTTSPTAVPNITTTPAPSSSSGFPLDLFENFTTTSTSNSQSSSSSSTTTTTNMPSPSLRNPMVKGQDKDRIKKELETIHKDGPKKPAATGLRAGATSPPTVTEFTCPICQQKCPNERVLGVHIDDWHPSSSSMLKKDDSKSSSFPFDDPKKDASMPSKDNNGKPRSKTVSFAPQVTKDKKSVSFESDEKRRAGIKTTTTTTTSSSTSSSSSIISTTTSSSTLKPHGRSDHSPDLSTSFESIFIPPKPVRILTQDQAAIILQSYVRRWKARKDYKREQLRTKAVRELINTECTYVEGLEKLIEHFAFPLRGLCQADIPMISQEEVDLIFGKHEIILSINKDLYRRLVERVCKWTSAQKIGDILVEFVTLNEFKTIYNNFTLSFQNILSTIERLSNAKSSFRAFLKNSEKSLWTNGSATGTNLQSLLITPVQRITRYLLLLKEIIKYTKPSHADYDDLCISLFEVQDICTDVNENQRKEENEKIRIQTLTNIANRIENKPKDFQLVTDSRFLIREGHISQYSTEEEKGKDRIYYLFNDLLLIAKESKKKLQLKNNLPLSNVKLRNINDGQKCYGTISKNAFELQGHGNSIMMFFTETPEEKESLIKELEVVLSSFILLGARSVTMIFFNSLKSKYGPIERNSLINSIRKDKKPTPTPKIQSGSTTTIQSNRKRYAKAFVERNIPNFDRFSVWHKNVFFQKALDTINKKSVVNNDHSIVELDLSKIREERAAATQPATKTKVHSQATDTTLVNQKIKKQVSNFNRLKRYEKLKESLISKKIPKDLKVGAYYIYDNILIKCDLYDQIITWPIFQFTKWYSGMDDIQEAQDFLQNSEKALLKFYEAVRLRDFDLLDKMILGGSFKDSWFRDFRSKLEITRDYPGDKLLLLVNGLKIMEFSDSLVYSWFDEDSDCDVVTAHKFYAKQHYTVLDNENIHIQSEEKSKMYFGVVQWTKDAMGDWRIKSLGYEFPV
ncbi:C2H2-type zinc finger-containing protein [Heterostelium album PN500]|uniref:C2H2-type zinc finger-containing protein n=1 Tax=Heterostelium pallidum (strain ATCC 26659 / Pp 5 / PN500) TaxID=670386 RepID=D3BJI0_HETP5|nr:C2H2-type zinc finger-containing protein [Heterostelium album PN500]EFA78060.1 C2H2-type zinc finger-containing protein [Heterostelium album PN500]|eukprot:XP_020430187.1 C2H2-type zinc finger-containing protein [Heterostelium album PN500]